MSESAADAASTSARRYNGWRTSTLVLALLCIALAVGWIMRERQLHIDQDQSRQDYEITIKSLQKELDGRGAGPAEEDAPSPATRPAMP
jgi:phage gp36-like protein